MDQYEALAAKTMGHENCSHWMDENHYCRKCDNLRPIIAALRAAARGKAESAEKCNPADGWCGPDNPCGRKDCPADSKPAEKERPKDKATCLHLRLTVPQVGMVKIGGVSRVCLDCVSVVAVTPVCDEKERLEREVIEAAVLWEADYAAGPTNTSHAELSRIGLHKAVAALRAHQAGEAKGKSGQARGEG